MSSKTHKHFWSSVF